MKIALVGNQNSGKTTLFNLLTGLTQKVGNWPGVTIEKKVGKIRNTDFEIIDLPGIYSLSPYSSEEEVSRKFVFEEKPDLIINIVDATSIERSLYLTTQLLELDCHVILALNMSDMLTKKGIVIDSKKLSKKLNTTVVEISALKNKGIDELINCIKEDSYLKNNQSKIYPEVIEEEITKIVNDLQTPHKRFVAVKLLENDKMFQEYKDPAVASAIKKLEDHYKTDMEQVIANERYKYVVTAKKDSVIYEHHKETTTDKIDKIFLNKWAAIPIFAVIMILIYYLAVGVVGSATVDFVDSTIGNFGEWVGGLLSNANAAPWAISLVVDGIIAGVGAVLNFVPQLIILFICISILETTGYMSRIAFVLDRIFIKFGLSGKSLIPFIVGSGCSVPGIMACRTIEDEDEKRMTIMLTPFIPCSAKLPIIALFAGYFFPKSSGLVSASMYFLAIAVILMSAIIMKKFFFKGQPNTFISELPEYKAPSVKYIGRDVGGKTWAFIKRAGTIILLCSVVVWFLASFTWKFKYIDGEMLTISQSMLAGVGKGLSWIFYPILGELNWGATVSAIQGLVAKEQVVSSMEIIAGLSEGAGNAVFTNGIFSFFGGLNAYSFMVFNLFSAPCFGAIGAMKRELGSSKKMWQAVLFQTGLAWVLASLVFLIGSLIGMIF